MDETIKEMNKLRFMEVSKTFKQMMETPKVDVMIMTRETFETLKQYLKAMDIKGPTFPSLDANKPHSFSDVAVYFHQWLGDLIVYGDSRNKLIKRIINSCENRNDDTLQQGLKMKEVIT